MRCSIIRFLQAKDLPYAMPFRGLIGNQRLLERVRTAAPRGGSVKGLRPCRPGAVEDSEPLRVLVSEREEVSVGFVTSNWARPPPRGWLAGSWLRSAAGPKSRGHILRHTTASRACPFVMPASVGSGFCSASPGGGGVLFFSGTASERCGPAPGVCVSGHPVGLGLRGLLHTMFVRLEPDTVHRLAVAVEDEFEAPIVGAVDRPRCAVSQGTGVRRVAWN